MQARRRCCDLVSVEHAHDPEWRAGLLQSIEDGFADIEHGEHMDAFEFVARLRAKREPTKRQKLPTEHV